MRKTILLVILLGVCLGGTVSAQDETFTVNGYLKLQSGVFMPLLSDMFKPHENEAFIRTSTDIWTDQACDPIANPSKPCYPRDHGKDPGSLSMFRATAQIEADWRPHEAVNVHGILRGVRSLVTAADAWAQMPVFDESLSPYQRREKAKDFVLNNYYKEFELREFYLDVYPSDWLSFRIGRQQVTWGETGQFRLLDVINPIDSTWHFGPLESFEDTRIPLWIVKGLWEFPSIDHSLELVWVPGIDRPEDMVTTPLTFVGAWGVPYTNTPSPFIIKEKIFMYPENDIEDVMRVGLRWKGTLGTRLTYTLMYYYTHQVSPPIPMYFEMGRDALGRYDSNNMERLFLGYPRQHIAGFSLDFTLEHPIGAVVKLEAAIEPDRMFPQTSTTYRKTCDMDVGMCWFDNPRHVAVNYALVVMRPTMIRWLNPTQNFMMVFQFMHSMVPGMTEEDEELLVEVPGLNDYKTRKWDSMKFIFATFTQYLNGLLTPKLVVAYIYPDSAFISAELAVRLGDHWRVRLQVNDFFGADPYKGVGLFRDRDEINLSILCQF